jgi:hypothetical protein
MGREDENMEGNNVNQSQWNAPGTPPKSYQNLASLLTSSRNASGIT